MRAASSEVIAFGDERAIVLERYDRVRHADGSVTRVHQEDMCQALGVYPDRKYGREDGGPGAADVVALLREHIPPSQANEAIEMFCRALAFNWVICGPDAHAKNYSLLLSGPNVRLAPLYDISSVAPYPDRHDLRHMAMAMAMAINKKYENSLVTGQDWVQLARALAIESDQMTTWVHDVVSRATDALAEAVRSEDEWIADLQMAHQLIDGVAINAKALLRWMELAVESPSPTPPRAASQPSPRSRLTGKPTAHTSRDTPTLAIAAEKPRIANVGIAITPIRGVPRPVPVHNAHRIRYGDEDLAPADESRRRRAQSSRTNRRDRRPCPLRLRTGQKTSAACSTSP